MVQSGAISANCLIKVTDYTLSVPNAGKKVLCIAGLTVLKTGEEVGQKLGDPTALRHGEQQNNTNTNGSVPAPVAPNGMYWRSTRCFLVICFHGNVSFIGLCCLL